MASVKPQLMMSGETILIVEDNDITRQGLKIVLEAGGYRVLTAIHGMDALDQMQRVSPDLILSDIAMPEMDGYELFDAVRSRPEWVTIPFIFLTARGEREDVFRGKRLGAEDYLIKPISGQELLATVHSRLVRSQELLLAQLQQAYEASLILFANAIEQRAQSTRGHVERVMNFSLILGRQMGWESAQVSSLLFGSILHDIGKIHIRESILTKPGPLDDEEWQEMKMHPVVGVELIKNIQYLAPAIPVILHHHERWDGQGYPDGLAGEAIPLPARIVAVADALDVMTSNRVYRTAISPEQAYAEIVKGSENRYDPAIVEAFKVAWEELKSFFD